MRGLRLGLFSAFFLGLALGPAARAGATFRIGGPLSDYAADMALDGAGNLYLVGGFRGTMDFDPGPETVEFAAHGTPEDGGEPGITEMDAFVAKYDPDGRLLWAHALGGPNTDLARCVIVDSKGAVCVGGQFSRSIDFDLSDEPDEKDTLRSGSGRDAFVAKYDPDGAFLWMCGFGDEDVASKAGSRSAVEWSEGVRALAVDAAGNLYLAGQYSGVIDLDPGEATVERKSFEGGRDFFVVSLDATGAYRWGFAVGAKGLDQCTAMAVGGDLLVLGGLFSDKVDFDPGPGKEFAEPDGDNDAYLAWFDLKGNLQKLATWGGYGMDQVNDGTIVIDKNGCVYAAGEFKGKTDFAPGRRKVLGFNEGATDAFVVRYDSSGRLDWALTIGGAGTDAVHALCLDKQDNVVITGRYQRRVDFAPGRRKFFLGADASGGSTNAFVASYSPKRKLRWARSLGDDTGGATGLTRGIGVAARPDGQLVVFGTFFGTLDVMPGRKELLLPSAGKADLFVVRYDADGNSIP